MSEILAFLQLEGVSSPAERRRFLNLMQVMDAAWLNGMAEKEKQRRPTPAPRP